MTFRQIFIRKIVYLGIIAVLLLPLFWLGQPATVGARGVSGGPGGLLAQLRTEYGLSEAELGEIDPTSEAMRLATLGLRGVAANILWKQADTHKMKKDWTSLSATLEQLVKLEPHFISVWRFQAWNLSYNVSAEFDDYRKRYDWVIRGIEFLKKGIRYNEFEPKLVWDTGWFIAQKIGRADEWKQFRRLFRDDDDFHATRPKELRDNWLVGKEWFQRGEQMVDQGAVLRGISPLLFYSDRPMCQMNYSEYLERDGIFGERAKRSWVRALEEWLEFGNREFPTSGDEVIRLNDREALDRQVAEAAARLDELAPGLREKIRQEKLRRLTPEERIALETLPQERTVEQQMQAFQAEAKITVSHREVAQRISGPNRQEALRLADEAEKAMEKSERIVQQRTIVNFEYWRMRAQFEQTPQALEARELIYLGDEAFRNSDLIRAKEYYDKGLAKWRELLDLPEFPQLVKDGSTGRELLDIIRNYQRILDARDEPWPQPFILQDVIDLHKDRHPDFQVPQ